MKKCKKGFTLAELCVVMAVIAILAAVVVPSTISYLDKAHNSNADVELTEAYKYLKNEMVHSTATIATYSTTNYYEKDDMLVVIEDAQFSSSVKSVSFEYIDTTPDTSLVRQKVYTLKVTVNSFRQAKGVQSKSFEVEGFTGYETIPESFVVTQAGGTEGNGSWS